MTSRRFFLASALPVPKCAWSQKALPKVWRVGYIGNMRPDKSPLAAAMRTEFDAGLREAGYTEGANLIIEARYAEGRQERYPELAAELVANGVNVIVVGGTLGALAARNATATIPIVMAIVSDPVASGLVASLARPGGNVTGISDMAPDLDAKRFQLLREVAPTMTRVAVLWSPLMPPHGQSMATLESLARRFNCQLLPTELRSADNMDAALRAVEASRPQGLIVLQQPAAFAAVDRIVELAMRLRIPSAFEQKIYPTSGGLFSYGPSYPDQTRRAAAYVAKILKGAKPADLPVEQPTRFEFVINMRTAKALGLVIPQTILLRADEVLQ